MADEKEIWGIDLDTKDFKAKAGEALDMIKDIGDGKNLKGLMEGLGSVAKVAGVVGAATLAVKAALNLEREAEEVKAINAQFELLGHNAGVATDALKKGLVEAANGLADDTDLLRAANKALIEMGGSAKDLPQTLELARKVTSVFGGELVDNFENLNHAIAAGQSRALKNMGIIVDQKKAYEDYARSIGVAVGALSEAGKQQAMLNAVLAQGQKAFKGVNPAAKETQDTMTQMSVAVKQMGETLTLFFDKIFGSTIRASLKEVSSAVTGFKDFIVARFGEGAEQSEAKLKSLETRLVSLKSQLEQTQKAQGSEGDGLFARIFQGSSGGQESAVAKAITAQISQTEAEVSKLRDSLKKLDAEKPGGAGASSAGDSGSVDLEKKKQLETQFQADLLKIRQSRAEAERRIGGDEVLLIQQENAEKLLLKQQFDLQIQQIDENINLGRDQKKLMVLEVEKQQKAEMIALEEDLFQKRMQFYDGYQRKAQSVGDGIVRAFKAGAMKNKRELQDFGKLGQSVYDSFSGHATDALMDLGEGTKSATDTMKGFFFGMLSDMAAKYGSFMLLASVYPPNPPGLAAGAGLLVLAGVLRGMAGGKGSAGGTEVSTGGSSSLSGQSSVLATRGQAISAELDVAEQTKDEEKIKQLKKEQISLENADYQLKIKETKTDQSLTSSERSAILEDLSRIHKANLEQLTRELNESISGIRQAALDLAGGVTNFEDNKKAVTIQIQGHYLETDQTKQMLTSLIRDSADATDYRVVQIGQK